MWDKYRNTFTGQIEAIVYISKYRPDGKGKGLLDRRMYRNIHFRKARTRSSPTRTPDTVAMDTYLIVWSEPVVPGKQSSGIAMQFCSQHAVLKTYTYIYNHITENCCDKGNIFYNGKLNFFHFFYRSSYVNLVPLKISTSRSESVFP